MAIAVDLNASPKSVLRSMRGQIVAAELGYPDVLHVQVRNATGRVWWLVTQHATWSPEDHRALLGTSIDGVELHENKGVLRCHLSNGSALEIVPGPPESDDDPPNWELITPDGVLLEFGPGIRWRISDADEVQPRP